MERRKTGGGAQCSAILTPDEEQVVELIPSSLSKGHAGVSESCMDITFGEEVCNQNPFTIHICLV